MRYRNVCVEAFGYTLPKTATSSEEIEQRLTPLYERLKLPEGRLGLMTGIEERRFWAPETFVGDVSVLSCRSALNAAEIAPSEIGLLVHGSVCRDFLEPATACRVHHLLGLPEACAIYDTSNACLGILNGMLQAANMIELGQIQAALVVGSENGCSLVDETIEQLNANMQLTRKTVKNSIASLTIGSASCAVLLVDRQISKTGNRLLAGSVLARTSHHELCQSLDDQAGQMRPLMETDSEQLMREGVATGQANFENFLQAANWQREHIDVTFCHQVGSAHRKLMLESIGMDESRDFTTFSYLGNTGSAALPVTMARAIEQEQLPEGSRVAMLGIGSGINSIMLAVDWQQGRCQGQELDDIVVS